LKNIFSELKMKLIALRLQVPDDTVRERAKTTGRESDRPQIIEQRIKDYHREMDAISFYFPSAKIVDIDGTLSEDKAWKAIQTVLDEAGLKPAAQERRHLSKLDSDRFPWTRLNSYKRADGNTLKRTAHPGEQALGLAVRSD